MKSCVSISNLTTKFSIFQKKISTSYPRHHPFPDIQKSREMSSSSTDIPDASISDSISITTKKPLKYEKMN